ncbi:benzoate/H(+) symporter BenE family transporter [Nocardia sp. NPDC101769]|uniref:benzoate/H(+) symporter BenE family transporter n=1 Tax=Nocardia sp. NPDC101769 TaxID=3364333 RepID=UPI0037F9CFA4
MSTAADLDTGSPRRDAATRCVKSLVPPLVSPRRIWRDTDARTAANGLIGIVFSATGPLAVIMSAGDRSHLTAAQLASWVFGVFFLNGVLTILASWVSRRPMGFFWTIPGTVLVGNSLTHLPWNQVVGAYFVTGALILALGMTGLVGRVMAALPMPIVMAMVAGVFVKFGTGLVASVSQRPAVAVPMIVVFFALLRLRPAGAVIPPVLAALILGLIIVARTSGVHPVLGNHGVWAAPQFTTPVFTASALTELVVPLAITVLVVQNGQGIAVLEAAGHRVPVTAMTLACGVWSLLSACVGGASTCLTGPTNALLTASGARERQYTAGIVCGLLALLVGALAPACVALMLALPAPFIAALAGLAMLAALQSDFGTAFSSQQPLGALAAFLVTVAGIDFGGISSAFWGLVVGLIVSALMNPRTNHAPPNNLAESADTVVP